MRVRRPMIQTQPDLGGARDESSSRPSGHGGVNTPGTHLVTSHLASHTYPVRPGDPPGSVRDRSERMIGERSPAWGDGHHRSEIRNPKSDWPLRLWPRERTISSADQSMRVSRCYCCCCMKLNPRTHIAGRTGSFRVRARRALPRPLETAPSGPLH